MKNCNKKQAATKAIWTVARLLFGATFVVSGFVKAVDPLGVQYKIEDYLAALNLSALQPLAFGLGLVLFAVEFVIGCNFLFSIRMRETSFVALLFMCVMTPITLWIALENPVTDCGCFGDAIILSNWATFWKNIALLAAVMTVIFLRRKVNHNWLSGFPSWTLTATFFIVPLILAIYGLHQLPIIDFRPYKIGNNITELMTIPPDAPRGESRTTLIYEKNGEEREFTLQNYPAGDTTWHFVDQKTVQISEGYVPPIHDFVITDAMGDDITDIILESNDTLYLVIMYDLQKTCRDEIEQLTKLQKKAENNGQKFFAVTSSGNAEIEKFSTETGTKFPFCTADPIMLKTVVRANPGVVVLKHGTILDKFPVY